MELINPDYKIIKFGDTKVRKTSIIMHFRLDEYDQIHLK